MTTTQSRLNALLDASASQQVSEFYEASEILEAGYSSNLPAVKVGGKITDVNVIAPSKSGENLQQVFKNPDGKTIICRVRKEDQKAELIGTSVLDGRFCFKFTKLDSGETMMIASTNRNAGSDDKLAESIALKLQNIQWKG